MLNTDFKKKNRFDEETDWVKLKAFHLRGIYIVDFLTKFKLANICA